MHNHTKWPTLAESKSGRRCRAITLRIAGDKLGGVRRDNVILAKQGNARIGNTWLALRHRSRLYRDRLHTFLGATIIGN
jgi:hypothetical protein